MRAKKGQFATCKRPTFKFCSKDNAGKLYFDIVEGFCYCGGVFQNAGTFFAPPVDVSRGFRATCRQNIYFAMFACSCKGRRFQNRCVKCGTMCSPVFTVELILLFFVQTTLFFTCFQKFVRLLCKKLFLDFKHFLFLAFFPIKCCLFRLITELSGFFYFFLLTQPCFYLLSEIVRLLCKKFFSFVNFSFFRRFSQRTVARFR